MNTNKLCPNGHLMKPTNIVWRTERRKSGKLYRTRRCKVCRNESSKLSMRKKRGTPPGAYRGWKVIGQQRPKAKRWSELQPYLAELWAPTRPVKSQCLRGHPFKGRNIMWKRVRGKVYRGCRKCDRIHVDKWQEKQ